MNKYVCTAIPYVNGAPHIGNALDYLLADIWARWQREQGNSVRFQVGTDEHGNKIAAKAESENKTPKEYVDENFVKFRELMEMMNTTWTDFIRTSDAEHEKRVQEIWKKLGPHIYKGSYKGWYCQGCEAFFSEKEAEGNEFFCPDHKRKLTEVSEENYFLRMADFEDRIVSAIEKDEMKITPSFRKREFLNMIKDGMPDVSISRPRKSLTWGVAVPNDPDQVIYVWIDSLSNYITVLGYPDNDEYKEWWPAELQIVGKDILRFHAGIWPAILLGLGLPLPKEILVHGHVTVDGEKMSKTVGNVVDPFEVIEKYGVDGFRYFFTRHVPTMDDGDFSWTKMEEAYNNELANELGNLVSRVAAMCGKYEIKNGFDDGEYREVFKKYAEFSEEKFASSMESLQFGQALEHVWRLVQGANRFVDENKPWELAKSDTEKLQETMRALVAAIRIIGEKTKVFMPATSERILAIYNASELQKLDEVLFAKMA
ncbi:methionine--tRNA ligase [Candidatus Saccharibacteria bacterium]|nr:methionine--tRNA ligase [Candidatus Saccharibacteria bacterium]